MHRNNGHGYDQGISDGLAMIPARLRHLTACDIAVGIRPGFVDLHHWDKSGDDTGGHSYDDTPHTVHPYHQMHRPVADRLTTVVFPTPRMPEDWWIEAMTIHELGHVLHSRLEWPMDLEVIPVTDYAESNRFEAFAEAFMQWCLRPYGFTRDRIDPGEHFRTLMDSLCN